MKKLLDKAIGGDGASVEASAGVQESNLRVEVAVEYPLAKIIEPAAKVADKLVDKIEQWIPGDQTGLADKLKQEFRKELADAIAKLDQAKA